MANVHTHNSKSHPHALGHDDPLIKGLLEAKDHKVEVIAFGIAYHGVLKDVNVEYGYIKIEDGKDQATLEFERIESFHLTE